MKPSGIGGQAVLEGVMMKNKDKYAVAVRKTDGEITVEKGEFKSITEKYKFLGLPFIRGVVNFVESLKLGMSTLTFSASLFDEEEKESKIEKKIGEKAMMGLTVAASLLLAIAIFMLLPFFIASLLEKVVKNGTWLAVIEGALRIVIFIGYVLAISLMKDIRRVFMYHGAEHKCINCIEHGQPLTVENVRKQTTRHKRCGTSFMLFVIVLSAIFFMFIRVDNMVLRVVLRLVLIPVIAGVSYELLKLAGRSENPVVNALSMPGLWLQALTTREPDDEMIEVGIKSVEAVFDWESFISEGKKSKKKDKQKASEKKSSKHVRLEEVKEEPEAEEKEEVKAEAKAENKAEAKVEAPEKAAEVKAEAAEEIVEISEFKKSEAPETKPLTKATVKRAHIPAKDPGDSKPSIESVATGYQEDNEDDEILNALDRFFSYKREEATKLGEAESKKKAEP